ncbi:unnamed protein product [Owenia fusiformis]|uniref:ADP-ribosylation factor-like protein 2-binding protein n=1 Tax=Owenia fusiformis TaxID=6347 RepID=A0A8J1Y7Y9_OWEFU|nr:unnamed protein product [Owenia fusiformis]
MAEDGKDGQDLIEPMDFQEEELATSSSSIADTKFDITVGHIEDIIIEDKFQNMQACFMDKYYREFEDTEENKFCYTDIHKEYLELVEKHLDTELNERMPGFSMDEFSKQLISRKQDLEGEVFDMLLTFSDFLAFKEMFLDYKAVKEGDTIDLSSGFTITPLGALGEPAATSLRPGSGSHPDK